jgi:nitroreductase
VELFEAIRIRASVRRFAPCTISEAELGRILDAGRRAPSGYNRQPWEFILVQDRQLLDRLGRIQNCIAEAAAAVAVIVDERATRYWREDAAAAIQNMLLAAVALGYASLWVEGYVLQQEDYARSVLGVPKNLRVLAILPIGKPVSAPRQAEKKPLAELLHRDRYGSR